MAENKIVEVSENTDDVTDSQVHLELTNSNSIGSNNELTESADINEKSIDDIEEDLLNYDIDVSFEISGSSVIDTTTMYNNVDVVSVTKKRKIEETHAEVENELKKKVILDNTDTGNSRTNDEASNLNIEDKSKKVTNILGQKRIIKLSQISAEERLEMRARKFGIPISSIQKVTLSTNTKKVTLSADVKRTARAKRFGIKNTNSSTIEAKKVNTNTVIFKQRVERFGGSVSNIVLSLENKGKMESRKIRFGTSSTKETLSYAEKAERRLKRFLQPVN